MKQKKGANFARNKGIKNAKGDFICFLDDDDVYLDNHLQTMYDLVIKNDKEVALYRSFTKRELSPGVFEPQEIITRPDNSSSLDHLMTVLLVMHCVCSHREIFDKIKFDPDIPVAQDYHLWVRILTKFPLYEAPSITTIYHKTEGSISSPSMAKYYLYIEVYGGLFDQKEVSSQLSRKIIEQKMLKFYDLLLSCHYNELTILNFVIASFYAAKYNLGYLFSIHFIKLFIKFWMHKIFRK